MTASTTPRLGLILPSGPDLFEISDFDQTFTKIDGTPGTTPVANFAALPSGLTSAQHGSCYLQTDNGSMWMWNKPGGAAGTWKKINTVGMLGSANQPSAQSTAATTASSGATLVSLTVTAAGGRRVLAFFSHDSISNNGPYGASTTAMFINGSTAAAEFSNVYAGAANKGISHRLLQDLGTPAPGTSLAIVIKMASVANAGGGTTNTNGTGQLYIWEI